MPRADLHVHTCYSPDSLTALEALARRCRQSGLDCIAVTDHNTIQGALRLKETAPFTVITGEEIRTTGGDIIGLFLRERVPPGLTPLEAVRAVKDQGGLVSIPHPFDRVRSSVITAAALDEVLPHADMIETFNARNTNPRHDELAAALAARAGLPGIAVSDAHTAGEVGRTSMELPPHDGTPQGFLAALRAGRPQCKRSSPLVHMASAYAKARKRLFWSVPC
ncbi:MAG: PHP domain-containing protein [Chloroflexi bacterium]|nr:PHP domain-containing protein [Chloroflexota bacterium]